MRIEPKAKAGLDKRGPGLRLRGELILPQGRPLFRGLEFKAEPGVWTCLLGASGVGKSTLLRLLGGLETAGVFRGEILVSDRQPLAGRAAWMAQSDLLAPWLSVRENVAFGARLRGEKPDWARVDALLAEVGLKDWAQARPAALSGGMRQRAALARTLMENRPVALMDEAFSALDAGTRARMQELAFGLLQGRTVILATHDPGEAARLASRAYVLVPDPAGARLAEPHRFATPPLRDPASPDALAAQAALLAELRKPPLEESLRERAS